MSIIDVIDQKIPIDNIPQLLGWQHGNVLGINSVALLVATLVIIAVMHVFNVQIRYRDKAKYYPVVYALFAVAMVCIYYYCFQGSYEFIKNDEVATTGEIGWFCQPNMVGMTWAIINCVLLMGAIYCLLCATMQITAQLSVEAKMVEGKKWKEWKDVLIVVLVGITVVAVGNKIDVVFGSWALVAFLLITIAFIIFKIVLDAKRCHSVCWGTLIGLTYFVGIIAVSMLVFECLRGILAFLLVVIIFFSMAKARKKKVKKNKKA